MAAPSVPHDAGSVAVDRRCVVCDDPLPEAKVRLCGSKACRNAHYVARRRGHDRSAEMANRNLSGRIFRLYRDKGRQATCRGCLSRFAPRGRWHSLFCSRECYQRDKRARGNWLHLMRCEYRPAESCECVQCGSPFMPTCSSATVCSEGCRRVKQRIGQRRRMSGGDPPCHHCGTAFTPTRKHQRLCSSECLRAVLKQRRAANREQKKRREHALRALVRGRQAERFSPIDIFKRDHWRCQRCGIRCLPRYAHGDMRSPTLDHIIPISKGGDHTRANTQLLCNGCNCAKSNKVGGDQLRLIG